MWRLWTRGWGPRDWWYWFRKEGLPFWIARHLPKRVMLWAFIIVYGNGFDSLKDDYKQVYDAWVAKHAIR